MNRRFLDARPRCTGRARTLRAGLFIAGLSAAAACGSGEQVAPHPQPQVAVAPRPDVILVTWDTVRADHIAPTGTPRHLTHTPRWDKLAAESVVFEEARSPTPMTLPSHASILTGLQPPRHGARNNGLFILRDTVPTLAEAFRDAGHQTAAFVSADVLARRYGLARGFEHYDDYVTPLDGALTVPERDGRETVEAALRFVHKADRDRPLFLWVHLFDPHREWDAPAFYADRFDPYRAEIAYADAQTALLLDGLEADGRLDDAIVVLTSDHGESLGEHGEATHSFFAYDSTLRVPLLVWASPSSGRIAGAGARVAGPASLVDLAPTLRELAGLPPQRSDGRSLVSQLGGTGAGVAPRDLPIENVAPAQGYGTRPIFGVVTADQEAWFDLPRRERYDLARDPGQLVNLYDEETDGERADALFARFPRDWPPSSGQLQLDAASRQRLEALGYVVGGHRIDAASDADPKDWIELNVFLSRKHLLRPPREVLAEARALRERFGPAPALVEFETHVLETLGRSADALALLERAASSHPGDVEIAAARDAAVARRAALEREATSRQRALRDASDDPDRLRALAIVRHQLQDFDRAIALYRASLEAEPGDLDTRMNLALALAAAERDDEARAVLGDLLDRSDHTPEHACIAGRTLAFQLDRRERGLEALASCRARGGALADLDRAILDALEAPTR